MLLGGNQKEYIVLLFPWYISHFLQNFLGMKFDKDPSFVEENNYLKKIVNAYIIYELDIWQKVSRNNLKLKNCLFGATNIVKLMIKLNGFILAIKKHLKDQVRGVLVMIFLKM